MVKPTMELWIAGLEADGWWIVMVFETSLLAERGPFRYRLFFDP